MPSVTNGLQPANRKNPEAVHYPPNIGPSDDNKYHVYTTACQYCIVGCGYKIHVWDGNKHPGPHLMDPKKALWISPSMTDTINQNGQLMRAAVVPDPLCELNNGNHSVRGGSMGRNLVSPGSKSTEDRLKKPQIRINGTLEEFTWEEVAQVMASLIRKATDFKENEAKFKKPEGLGVKMYGYQFIENTFAATKLFFDKIGTPNLTHHDRPALASSTPGLSDAGFGPHDFSYRDIQKAETILLIGSNPYENASVFFMNYMMGKKLICIDPRRHITADYAVNTGGLHLQLKELGTDVVLLHAIARVILENGWEDSTFIDKFTGKQSDLEKEGEDEKKNWRRIKNATTFQKFKNSVLNTPEFDLPSAEEITGIDADQIREVAELIAKPENDGTRPRTSIIFEKGIIWGFNYQNTTAVANLAVLIGSVGQPGRVTGRAGGHQKGWVKASDYPIDSASDYYMDNDVKRPVPNNVDDHILNNEIKLYWTIGCNPAGQTNDAQTKWTHIKKRIHQNKIKPTKKDINHIIEKLSERMEQSGLVLVHQDIYPNLTTMEADIVLPAAGWGEENFSRWNGERRLRIYERFQDSPSTDCLPDWKIFKKIALSINNNFSKDFNWNDAHEIFRDAAGSDSKKRFKGIMDFADEQNKTGHQVLRDLGTNGIILPTKLIDGKLTGTPSLYPKETFNTRSGKLFFLNPGWNEIKGPQKEMQPDGKTGELWITNGRFNHTWNSMFTHSRNDYISKRYPVNMPGTILEINKNTAEKRDLNNGDVVSVECNRITDRNDNRERTFKAVISIQDSLPDTVAFALFSYPAKENKSSNPESMMRDVFTDRGYVNNITTAYVDPINPIAAFKYAHGKIVKTGEVYSVPKGTVEGPVFGPRNKSTQKTDVDSNQTGKISFKKQILPLLSRFSQCHNALSTYKSLMDTGWVTPNSGRESELIKRLKGEDGVQRMPKGGPYFKDEEIGLIEKWIDEGAHDEKEAGKKAEYRVPLADIPTDQPVTIKLSSKTTVFLQKKEGEIMALSAKCTHRGCTVKYQDFNDRYWCHCHGGTYALDGTVLSPPPTQPLKSLETYIEGDEVVVLSDDPDDSGDNQAGKISFKEKILPLLSRFSQCHSVLSSYQSLMGTGWIDPKNGAGSELVKRLKGEDGLQQMPMGGPYFEDKEIGLIEKWIDEGAKDDGQPPQPIPVVKTQVLIIGGGVAGLAAGVELIERGFEVTLITEGHRLGGKGSSWRDARVDPKATWHDHPEEDESSPKHTNSSESPHDEEAGPSIGKAGSKKHKYKGPAIINHGFHAVFGFYHNFIDLLKRVDAYKNLVPSDHSLFLMEGGKIHRLKYANLPFPFHILMAGIGSKAFTFMEKVGFGLWGFNIFRQDPKKLSENYDEYDYHSLASWSRGRGLRESTIRKNVFRMLQEGDFNFPYGFSAYASLNGIIEMFKDYESAGIYYFNGGITETLMDPIGEHFTKKGGKIVYWQKAIELKHDNGKIAGVVATKPVCHHGLPWGNGEVPVTQENKQEYQADYYISTLPAENFKELNPGDRKLWDIEYFRNMWAFDTIETFAYQVWLNNKVKLPEINNVVVGLETPFSTAINYKNIIDEYKNNDQLGAVLDMVGSQGFFHHSKRNEIEYGWTEEQIKELALSEIVKYDEFKVCRDPNDPTKFDKSLILHDEFHENNARHNRFFLTLPKSTEYRPLTKSPFPNLFLAGDWIRNKRMDLICMEGACISGKLAANEILLLNNKEKTNILSKEDSFLLKLLRILFGWIKL